VRDPLVDAHDVGALRALALGLLFLGGATVGLLSLLLPTDPRVDRPTEAVLASLGYPTALALLTWGRRWPSWAAEALLAGGTLLTTGGIYAAHGSGVGASAAFFYVWVALFAFHFLSLWAAVLQLSLAAGSYAAVQGLDGGPGAPSEWVLAMGTAIVAGVVMLLVSRQLRKVAVTDHLTGLPNRHVLQHLLAAETARAARNRSPLCVSVIDVDGFKAVNDRLGHESGDAVLVDEARAWSPRLRATDTLIRYGGDEFVVVLPGTTLAEATSVIERLVRSGPVPASAGMAEAVPGDDPDALLRRADRALYEAKRNGPRHEEATSSDQVVAPCSHNGHVDTEKLRWESLLELVGTIGRANSGRGLSAPPRAADSNDPG
jgi:diguanylate cyclase (GGDEF)-like protein